MWITVKSRFCIFITIRSILGGSFPFGLLRSGRSGLWSVDSRKCCAPIKYMCSLVVLNSASNASLSICEWCFLVSVNDLLTKWTGQ